MMSRSASRIAAVAVTSPRIEEVGFRV